MTRYAPLWQQAGSYPASVDRALLGALWPAGGCTGGAVAATANTMNVVASPGTAVVPLQSGQGSALCRWDSTADGTVTLAAAATNPRIDLVIVQVRDNALDSGGNNDFIITNVTGTPAASPSPPATPTNAYVLAQVTVPANAANLNGATITQTADILHTATDAAWTTPALQNGWVNASPPTGPIQYRRINGLVYFRGAGTGAQGVTIFTLPAAYTPRYNTSPIIRSSSANTGYAQIYGAASTSPAPGTVQVYAQQAGNAYSDFSTVVFDTNL